MLPSDMDVSSRPEADRYNNKILVYNGALCLGKNDKVNTLESETPKYTPVPKASHKETLNNVESQKTLLQKKLLPIKTSKKSRVIIDHFDFVITVVQRLKWFPSIAAVAKKVSIMTSEIFSCLAKAACA